MPRPRCAVERAASAMATWPVLDRGRAGDADGPDNLAIG
jgi:hypothetical protein